MNSIQLSIDTSTYRTLLCLSKGETILREWESKEGPYHGEKILAGIDEILKQESIPLKKLNFISVGIGPGTFTGLRIGVSSAKLLAEANNIPLLGLPSLEAQMFNIEEWEESIEGNPTLWSLTDARRNQVYVLEQSYKELHTPSRSFKRRTEYALQPEELAEKLKAGDILLGDGAKNYKKYWPKNVRIPTEKYLLLRPRHMAKLGNRRFLEDTPRDPIQINPIYIRTEKF